MLSPAFNVIASSLARNEVSREMDIAEMANSATSLDLISLDDDENNAIIATSSATAMGSGSHPTIQSLLKRYGAEVRLPHLEKESSILNDEDTSRRLQLRLKTVVQNFIRKESLRRAEELQLVAEVLQPAIHTAMTMRLSPTSHYLLSFSSTREITDESVSCALNLSPEDLSAVADMFMGSSGGGADRGTNTATLSSLFPRQFFDPAAPHNSLFSFILNRRKAVTKAEKEKVAKSSEDNDNDTAKQSEKGKRKDSSATAAAPAPLPSILDTFTDILEKILSEEGRDDEKEEDNESVARGDGYESSSASYSSSFSSRSSSSSRFSNGSSSSSSSCSRERRELTKKRDKDSTRKGRTEEGNTNSKKDETYKGNSTRGRIGRNVGRGGSSSRKKVGRRAAGGRGGEDGGMRALLETCRRKWAALFLVWGRWSTAMALASVGGGGSTASSSSLGGNSGSSISSVNLVELILKLLTSQAYPKFDSALQALVDVFESEESTPTISDNQRGLAPSPPPPHHHSNNKKLALSLTETILKHKDRALLLQKIIIVQSLARRLYARRVLFPRRFDALFGSGAFRAQYTCGGCEGTVSGLTIGFFGQRSGSAGNNMNSGNRGGNRSRDHSSVLSLQKQAKYFRSQRHQNTFATLLGAYSGQQETLLHYMDTARELMNAEAKAEDFYANEEERFNRQFKQWSAKMTKYFLEEVPLDIDWVVQKTPLPPMTPAAEAESQQRSNTTDNKKDGGGEFIDPETGLRYQRTFLNVKTGKVQTENPNVLKAIATKNRQLVKAQRERELRITEMNAFVREQINGVKSEAIPAFEKQLAAPIFL